jgi:DNA polymerase zeta
MFLFSSTLLDSGLDVLNFFFAYLCRNLEGISGCNVEVFPEERDIFNNLISVVCLIDPDIIIGWEIQLGGSLGFLAERAAHLGIGLLKRISRTLPHEMNHPPKNSVDESS